MGFSRLQVSAKDGPRIAARVQRRRFQHAFLTKARQVAARLPAPLAPLVPLTRRLALATGVMEAHRLPLVSIVVPIYAVEDYLAECLDSLLAQTYANLQIILVDDGSPDGSPGIMSAYACRDPRIEIVRQPNKGVAAARNTGVAQARGSYLMFADPDDVLDPDAVATHVESLERTHADFSVAPYRRFSQAGQWAPAWWISRAHTARRERITVTDHPDIQVNAVVWSKCFRRRFWQQHQISFPEGVHYEDQHVSSATYAVGRFDVLTKQVYSWRVRENQSSITQQTTSPDNLRERLAGARSALDALSAPHLKEAFDARLVQILQHDLQTCVRAAQYAGEEYWRVLRRGLQELTAGIDDALWGRVSVQQRIGIRFVLEDLRAETVWFTGLGRSNPKRSPSIAADGRLYLDTPARHILGVEPTHPDLAFADHQLGLVTSIRRLQWTEAGRLRITAWAYIDNLSLGDPETPVEIRVWAESRRRSSPPARVPLTVTSTPSAEVTSATAHRYADYERSVFEAELDPRALLPEVEATASWRIMVQVEAAGIQRTGPLREPYRAGSAGRPASGLVHAYKVVPGYGSAQDLRLLVRPIRCLVESAVITDQTLSVRVRGLAGFEPSEIEIGMPGGGTVRHRLDQLADSLAGGTIPLPRSRWADDGGTDPTADPAGQILSGAQIVTGLRRGRIRVVSPTGDSFPAAVGDPAVLDRSPAGGLHVERTRFGNLSVADERRTVRVRQVEVLPDHRVVVTGSLTGLTAAQLGIGLQAPATATWARAESTEDNGFSATISLRHDPWGFGCTPLPSGDYVLTAHSRVADDPTGSRASTTIPVTVLIEQCLVDQLSSVVDTSLAAVRLRLIGNRRLQVRLSPPLTAAERGSRQQQRLENDLQQQLARPRREPKSVLFRSNFGEIAGCNQLAVHRELVRRGADLRLYWAVKDHSVRVPDGGIPVIHESAEWYRLLHEAEFYLDNMHQPIYHRKPPHQVQVQTFHGYPFKQMGRANWVRQQREAAHVESYLERAKDWDFMVSPASYATQPLCEAFGFGNEVLEIGYPRNDALLHPVPQIATDTRKRLGIKPDQTAVLYAPTFREELAKNDFDAAMVDYLDIRRLTAALGPSHVLLVRGHAFNARRGERIGSAEQIIDVTDYPEVTELMLASDAAILDYSSLRFDYGLTGKPMIFLVPDLDCYVSSSRGAIMPYAPTAPGPLLHTTDDVITAVRELNRIAHDWAPGRAAFRERFLDLEDGHAAERLVDRVFYR